MPAGIRELATFALATGMRLDELLHLQWVDVDVARRLISVHRGRQGTVKSGKARHIPILDTLLPFVRVLALHRGGVLVFPGRNGRPRTKPGVQAVERARQATAVPRSAPYVRFALIDGGDIFRLSKILGHSTVVITHLVPEVWEQDYHRVAFTLPEADAVYGVTRRKLHAV